MIGLSTPTSEEMGDWANPSALADGTPAAGPSWPGTTDTAARMAENRSVRGLFTRPF
jgi:hypothetical protein